MRRRGLGWWAGFVVTLLAASFLVLPVAMVALVALSANWFQGPLAGLSLRWVFQVLDQYGETILLSLRIAAANLAATLVLGVPLAYALARAPGRLARAIEELIVLPVAVPGIATALGMVLAWGAVGGFRIHWTFILAGHVVFTLPFMVRAVLAVLRGQDILVWEEAARTLGASFWRRFFTVIVPNARAGILAGSLMVTTLSIGEFNMSLILHTPFTRTLPVGLADAYASLRIEVGSAYTLIFLVLVVPLLLAMQAVAGRIGVQPR
jgi:putative spermidine/putrescine transport system permease protein